MTRLVLSISIAIVLCCIADFARADKGTDFFEKKIRPVLVEHCYECHAGKQSKGGLLLDSRESAQRGGESGAAVVPKDMEASLILEAIRYESYEMPPSGKLPENVVSNFEKWIKMGAPDPREESSSPVKDRAKAEIDWDEARKFWAFQPPKKHKLPIVKNSEQCNNLIDHFIQHRLEKNGAVAEDEPQKETSPVSLAPMPRADARTLIRRMSYDTTGLPPTPEDVTEFTSAYEQDQESAVRDATDRLLSSPQYGERWTALWMDVMRYAEDQAHIVGGNKSLFYPNAYRYREWVIQSLNDDMPYDEFVRLQLAADTATPDDDSDDVALGFIGLGPKYYRRNAPEVMADEWEDRVDVVTRGLLGLTVACARCHDHKFDPIPTEDYYAIAGVYASIEMWNKPIDETVKSAKNGHAEKPDQSLHVIRDQKPHDVNVLIRGDVENKGEIVPRRFLTVLTSDTPEPFQTGSGRHDLANAITDRNNPLTARVIVNRVWGEYFGTPLVATPSNFGQLGQLPSHPELLDTLAVEFMEQNWSLKWLQRTIIESAAYQRSSQSTDELVKLDPSNQRLARMSRRRLSIEQWRDTLLMVTGQLDSAVGGKSIDPLDIKDRRRTVYSTRSRFQLNPLLSQFDFPDPNAHAAGRVETTTPLQKLFVMNSPLMNHFASTFANRIEQAESEPSKQIRHAYQLLYQRPPSKHELTLGREFLEAVDWKQYAQVLLASNELFVLD